MALADGSLYAWWLGGGDGGRSDSVLREAYGKRTLEGDVVAGDAVNGLLGNSGLAVDKTRGDVDALPLDGDLLFGVNAVALRRAGGRMGVRWQPSRCP